MKCRPPTMATLSDASQAPETVSAKCKNPSLPASESITHKTGGQQQVLVESPLEEHRGEPGREGGNQVVESTGGHVTLNSKTPLQTTTQESTKDCQCTTKQSQQPNDTNEHPIESSSDLHSAPHPPVATTLPHLELLNYETAGVATFRPPPPPPSHYYYTPTFDHHHQQQLHQYAASYYQNHCYPYSVPLNFELCYLQPPQLSPQHPHHSYSPKQQLLFLPHHHYNQQQLLYGYPTTDLNHHHTTPHSLRNFQQHPYQLYHHLHHNTPTPGIAPFYTPLFTTIPQLSPVPPASTTNHLLHIHSLPTRPQPASHATQLSYPLLSLNWANQHQPSGKNQRPISSDTPSIQKLLSQLPIEARAAKIRQAYGMDKVWNDEFEHLFSQLAPEVIWTFIEVESNPVISDSESILAYKGHYIIAKRQHFDDEPRDPGYCEGDEERSTSCLPDEEATNLDDNKVDQVEGKTETIHPKSPESNSHTDKPLPEAELKEKDDEDEESSTSSSELVDSKDSDCDSGAQTNCSSTSSETLTSNYQTGSLNTEQSISSIRTGRLTTKFRMFIDSAKVRFCCNQCGHGWTSMKGRVVFWYELFEMVDERQDTNSSSTLIGYCAYKLFGQQCDVCKVENRFERPMWYPEEVSKVLNNMYNKVGQVYFGFQMPTIDKQRRAGKPKTSHNSSLCQACQNGLCTDRK